MENVLLIVVLVRFVQGCSVGYFGSNCTKPCRYPSFGKRCQDECNCIPEMCDSVIGCDGNRDCEDGYYGKRCISPCRYPSYGKGCQQECSCHRIECNHIKGCENKTELQEWTTLGDVETNVKDDHQEAVIIGSCGVFVFITICVCLMIKLYISRRKRELEQNIQTSEYVGNLSNNYNARSTNYKSLELDESLDPEIYENTRIDIFPNI